MENGKTIFAFHSPKRPYQMYAFQSVAPARFYQHNIFSSLRQNVSIYARLMYIGFAYNHLDLFYMGLHIAVCL